MKKNLQLILSAIIIATGLLAYNYWTSTAPELGSQTPERYIPKIKTFIPESKEYQLRVDSHGIVQASGIIELISQVNGQIEYLNPKLWSGKKFAKDEVLVKIDDTDYSLAISIAEAQLRQADSSLQLAKAASELAIKDWQRIREDPINDIAAQKPQINSAEAQVLVAKTQLELAENNLKRCTLRAPFSGSVVERKLEVGQWISTGSSIATLISNQGNELLIPLSEQQLDTLNLPSAGECQPLRIEAEVPGKKETERATLTRISQKVEMGTRMNQAIAKFLKNISVPPGSYIPLTIYGENIKNTYTLPSSAVIGNKVRVVKEDKLHETEVATIERNANFIVITGLQKNATVCITPINVFLPGMKVEIVK